MEPRPYGNTFPVKEMEEEHHVHRRRVGSRPCAP
jgi:hypothetical protein